MFSTGPYYHRFFRKYQAVFGALFQNIYVVRYNQTEDTELYRIKVPIIFAEKEKWLARLRQDPNLTKEIEKTLPQMAYFMGSPTYDANRRQNRNQQLANYNPNDPDSYSSTYTGTPWDIPFTLSIIARNQDDAFQIVEQILPYFAKDYTVAMNLVPEMNITREIPIILTGVTPNIEYEGSFENIRAIQWDFDFVMKAWFFGPTANTGLIKTSTVTIFDNLGTFAPETLLYMYTDGSGTGIFMVGDIAYQGRNQNEAWGKGTIRYWNSNTGHLALINVTGQFISNQVVQGISSNGSWKVLVSEVVPPPMATVVANVNPQSASSNGTYTIDVTLEDWPNA